MTTTVKPPIGASSTSSSWDAIHWRSIKKYVQRLQMRIAKATREGRWGKVKALQWLLIKPSHRVTLALVRLELCAGKLACTVLRGLGAGNRPWLLGALRYGTQIILADRWYPSSRLCSCCDWKNETLTLKDREWICRDCGAHHDRDTNAALNLKRLATAIALPVANRTATDDAAIGVVPFVAGKVTPVRDDAGQQGASGQEINRAHIRALF